MSENFSVPKEQFLVDFFSKKKLEGNKGTSSSKPFDEIFKLTQLKIEKAGDKSLEGLMASPETANAKIDALSPSDTVSLLKDSVDKLNNNPV